MTTVTQTPYLWLREARALKLSRGPTGIRYAVLADPERSRLFINVVANEGGGNWNKEVVAFPDIERILASTAQGDPFTAKLFRAVYAGKSSNNSGFLAAALVHEGLIAPATGTKHKLVRSGDWSRWQEEQLALESEAILIPPVLPDAVKKAPAIVAAAAPSALIAEPEAPDTSAETEAVDAVEVADAPVVPTRKNQRGKNRLITVPSLPATPVGGDPDDGEHDASHP